MYAGIVVNKGQVFSLFWRIFVFHNCYECSVSSFMRAIWASQSSRVRKTSLA